MSSRNETPDPSQYNSTTLSSAYGPVCTTPEMSSVSLGLARSLLGRLETQAPSDRLLVGVPGACTHAAPEASSGLAEAVGRWLERLDPGTTIIIPFDKDFDGQDAFVRSVKLLRRPVGVVCDLNGSIAPAGPTTLEIPIAATGRTTATRAKVVVVSRSHRLVLVQMPRPGNSRRSMSDPDVTWDVVLDEAYLAGKKDAGVQDKATG